ncbi:MAG TPA: DUF2065 domain-containing protein [Gammaproteobacteria bacterium]|nr:DUF2065 domain-containing protein [Gammaproteobacteria bacterium]
MDKFLAALALVMVIEGVLPFLSPGTMRNYMAQMVQMDDRTLRITGLVSMLVGLGLLYLVK